jgi:putative SOS response-associated peptidase YedK
MARSPVERIGGHDGAFPCQHPERLGTAVLWFDWASVAMSASTSLCSEPRALAMRKLISMTTHSTLANKDDGHVRIQYHNRIMCGRYGRRADKQRIAEWMQAHNTNVFDDSYYAPSYNVAPQTLQPVVRLDSEIDGRELTIMRWGLVPFWSKDGKATFNTINARAETIATSPVYRESFVLRRCLVPAGWFYEWKKLDAKTKQPYAIAMKDGGMFAFAGLWDTWTDRATGESKDTYTIVTTNSNELMSGMAIHDRMPVILRPSDYGRWLDPGDPALPPVDLLRPFDAEMMTTWPVGPDVGNVRNNRPDLVEPLNQRD